LKKNRKTSNDGSDNGSAVDRTAMDHLVGLFDPRPDDSSVLTTALPPEVFVRR